MMFAETAVVGIVLLAALGLLGWAAHSQLSPEARERRRRRRNYGRVTTRTRRPTVTLNSRTERSQ